MFTFITLMNSLLCFTIIVSYIVLSLQHINDKLSTFLINPLVSSIYIDVIHTISVMLTNTTIILITKMFINIIVCFVTNITSCCNSRHSITYIHKLCQSYGEFKQTSPSYDTVKHNVVLLVLMIFMVLALTVLALFSWACQRLWVSQVPWQARRRDSPLMRSSLVSFRFHVLRTLYTDTFTPRSIHFSDE